MHEDDTKNISDSAVPTPPDSGERSDAKKKQMELGARMEHEQGHNLEELAESVEKLEE